MNNKKIGLFIASLRKAKNMTQKGLADKLYISDQAVSKWERGLSMPDIGLIEKLSEYLEVSVSEILKGEKIDNMTKNKSDEIMKDSIPFFQKKYFKNKIMFILSIAIVSIIMLGIILYIIGTIDYIRAVNGKKPIFFYHTVNVTHEDFDVEGTEYYGIGYKITLCNNKKNNYIFQIGHKNKRLCYTNLTCSDDENGTLVLNPDGTVSRIKNDKHSFEFTFFDDRLYIIDTTFLFPNSAVENEEILLKDYNEMNKVIGINASFKRINGTTYEMKQTCNVAKILKAAADGEKMCILDYFSDGEIFELTRAKIKDQYQKDACK
ncbi:MAG: helix-turn-helix transcriptional regulator [Bacilli bacterium]|nr:helix-turn-helix transcriptional regulator [Bacilli bacterium]